MTFLVQGLNFKRTWTTLWYRSKSYQDERHSNIHEGTVRLQYK